MHARTMHSRTQKKSLDGPIELGNIIDLSFLTEQDANCDPRIHLVSTLKSHSVTLTPVSRH